MEYFPYGETWIHEKAAGITDSMPYKFTAKELDSETNLYYVLSRYYDMRVGRWISADDRFDDMYSSNGLDLYCYVKNNPINFYDPDGHRGVGGPIGVPYSKFMDWLKGKLFGGKSKDNATIINGQKMGAISPTGGGKAIMSSPWPTRADPKFKPQGHPGIDLYGALGSPVYAAQDGDVKSSAAGNDKAISTIQINDLKYQHVKPSKDLTIGKPIKAGDQIGTLDDSGKGCDPPLWTGPHLHFQVGNGETNPIEFLQNLQPNLIWGFTDKANKDAIKTRFPILYNKMKQE